MKKFPKTKHGRMEDFSQEKNWRIYGLAGFIFFAGLCIVGKLYILQVIDFQTYKALAEAQHQDVTQLDAKRGQIFLKDNDDLYPLAVNTDMQMAYAVPKEISDVPGTVAKISSILALDQGFVQQKLGSPNDMFEILKHKLSDDEVSQIKNAHLAGIYLEPENFRLYPAGELASQLVGFVGSDGSEQRGMYGLEAYWDATLRGKSGMLSQEGDSQGRWIPVTDRNIQPAQDGPDLVLTIDRTVQFEVEKILSNAISQFQADSGTILVMDPKTGKILAMANQPSFDPNNFAQTQDISTFNNNAINQPYEPGSVFKVFTEAMGLEEGKITPDSTYTDKGVVNVAGYAIKNASVDPANGYGVQTMTQVLEKSLNTGVIYIENLVGNNIFADYVKRFGFGDKTGIDLPGELGGNTNNLSNPSTTINFYTAAFGQGITATPLQLASAYSAIANGGVLMKPYVVDQLRYSDGHTDTTSPQEVRQAVSQKTAQQAAQMLRGVVTDGNGKRADVPGYLVVGKTGTAQVAKAGGGGYEDNVTIGSFAGFAPMNDPRFTVVVKIVNPKTVQWAESSAAPTSGAVMRFLLQYYKINPTEDPATSPLAKLPPIPITGIPAGTPAPAPAQAAPANQSSSAGNSKVITSGD